jgi:hypothetical protein
MLFVVTYWNKKNTMKISQLLMSKTALSILLIGIALGVHGQSKYSNEFMNIGVGARGLALSNTMVSQVDDGTSGYWNPAGLLSMNSDRQISLMHSEYFAGIAKYDYGSFALKFDENSAGALSVIRFGVDNIPNTTQLIDNQGNIDYNKITLFSAADYGILLSYARKFPKLAGLKLGANAKIIRRVIGDFSNSWGFGIDIGAQYEYKKWKFGAYARDITTTFNAWSTSLDDATKEVFLQTNNEIPSNSLEITLPRLILGASRTFTFLHDFTAMGAVDFDITTDGKRNTLIKSKPFSIDPHAGIELGYKNSIFVRGGYGNIQQETDFLNQKAYTGQFNLGVGVVIKKVLSIDYALSDIGDNSIALYSNIFSLRLNINKKQSAPSLVTQ